MNAQWPVLRAPLNTRGRDFIAGDTHGMYYSVIAAMHKVRFDPEKDRLFLVGDIVDRGPDPLAMIRLVFDNSYVFSTRGNHEDMAIMYSDAKDNDPVHAVMMANSYIANGGQWFVDLPREKQKRIVELFKTMPYAIEIATEQGATEHGKVGLVHAEVPGDDWCFFTSWMEGAEEKAVGWDHVDHYALWGRSIVRERAKDFRGVSGIDRVFVGHTPLKNVTAIHNVHYMDTGACFNRKLSMLCLQTNEIIEIEDGT
jgi:serine/threonine protein phosphatase 1